MERYSRMLLHFIHALTGGGRTERVESFVFATRLTRITHQLLNRSVDDVVPTLPRTISDFGGGTQIGNALRMFNTEWARASEDVGPSFTHLDGWDRGTPEHLHKRSHDCNVMPSTRLAEPLTGLSRLRPTHRGCKPHYHGSMTSYRYITWQAL
ncbi:MAG: hypothetical protein CM1200mP25_1540 [Acidobacteriota bacterium]|nr:MAG: hypothetical protein CM1200mP25_1540 [Acidobacteriota bacterium]